MRVLIKASFGEGIKEFEGRYDEANHQVTIPVMFSQTFDFFRVFDKRDELSFEMNGASCKAWITRITESNVTLNLREGWD